MTDHFSVLLIEDELRDAAQVREAFGSVHPPIFELTTVNRFRDAIRLMREKHFHVVFADLAVPDSVGLNGLERLLGEVPAVPFIVLFDEQDDEAALETIGLGVQEFLDLRHIDPTTLLQVIRRAIKRKQFSLQQMRGDANSREQKKLQRLADLMRATTAVVTSRVDTLMKTELTEQQRSIVADIDKTSRESARQASRISPEKIMFVETD